MYITVLNGSGWALKSSFGVICSFLSIIMGNIVEISRNFYVVEYD